MGKVIWSSFSIITTLHPVLPHQDTASFPPQTQAGVSPVHKGEHLQLQKSLRAEFSLAYMGMGLHRLFCATYQDLG